MIRLLAIFVRSVNAFNYRLGKGLAWLIFGLIGLLFYEAMVRTTLGISHAWGLEAEMNMFALYFLLGSGYVLLSGAHIRMDILYSRWSVRRRAILDAATFFLAAIYLVAFIWRGSTYAITAIMVGERTRSFAATLVGPVKTVLVVGAVILLLQALAFFIQDLFIARGKALE